MFNFIISLCLIKAFIAKVFAWLLNILIAWREGIRQSCWVNITCVNNGWPEPSLCPFKSKLLNGTESYIFTVFGIPNINRYPSSDDKLTGSGYIYGISFNVDVWAILADEPLPSSIIEQIRLNINVDNEIRVNKITIN